MRKQKQRQQEGGWVGIWAQTECQGLWRGWQHHAVTDQLNPHYVTGGIAPSSHNTWPDTAEWFLSLCPRARGSSWSCCTWGTGFGRVALELSTWTSHRPPATSDWHGFSGARQYQSHQASSLQWTCLDNAYGNVVFFVNMEGRILEACLALGYKNASASPSLFRSTSICVYQLPTYFPSSSGLLETRHGPTCWACQLIL